MLGGGEAAAGKAEAGGAAAAVLSSSGGLLGAVVTEASGAGPLCDALAFHNTRPTMAAAATPPRPYQTARLPRAVCVVPQAAPVLEPATCSAGLEDVSGFVDMPLELSTREMRAALRGPRSGEKTARSAASAATSG